MSADLQQVYRSWRLPNKNWQLTYNKDKYKCTNIKQECVIIDSDPCKSLTSKYESLVLAWSSCSGPWKALKVGRVENIGSAEI